MTLSALFDRSLAGRRDGPGLEWQGATFTFGDLDARANRMAGELAARGLSRGDRLAVYLPNRLELVDLYLACTRLGVIYLPVNVLYREREIDHILRDAAPKAIVSDPGLPATEPVPRWDVAELAAHAAGRPADAPGDAAAALDAGSPAALVYTSGTTGAAKGAVLTHGNLVANALAIAEAWRITDADRFLLALPLFHVHGLGNGLHAWLATGARMRLLERFDHRTAADELVDFRATLFFGVPTMYVRLLEVAPDQAARIGRAMRLFVSGSAPLPPPVFEAFQERFGHAILERYGMTETLMTLGNPFDGERRIGSVGLPFPGVSVRIVDKDGRDVADQETGELWVRGPTVCAGYWGNDDATAAAFAGDWFRTGDLAVRAADGYYTLKGRRSDLIISGGFNIYPREVEDVLLAQPGVADAAVVGVPDPLRGERPVAFIVASHPDRPLDAAALEAACRRQLASFKVPRAFVAVDRLPRTALGKVQKHLLTAARER